MASPNSSPLRKIYDASRILYHWKFRDSVVLPYMPTEVSIELTNRCNFKCAFCPQSDPDHFDRVPATAVTPEQVGIILGKLRVGGVSTQIIHWTLDGEPFMNKSFHRVVRESVAHGFNTHHFATNAHLMTLDRLYEFPNEDQKYGSSGFRVGSRRSLGWAQERPDRAEEGLGVREEAAISCRDAA